MLSVSVLFSGNLIHEEIQGNMRKNLIRFFVTLKSEADMPSGESESADF